MRTSRFGASTRKLADSAKESKDRWYECPSCGKQRLEHGGSFALWQCRSCGYLMAGGAYSPRTEVGEIASRQVFEKG